MQKILSPSKINVECSGFLTTPRRTLGEPIQKTCGNVFVLDTCYLVRLANSGYGVYNSLKDLAQKGDVRMTTQVVEEFRRRGCKKQISELFRAINEGIVYNDAIDVSDKQVEGLSRKMARRSMKNNSRVGAGDASVTSVALQLRHAYVKVVVKSSDSDLRLLLASKTEISVDAGM